MPRSEDPITLERILCAAEETIRRFGPAKATVVDVARALGVSHTAVYRHVPTKADLRDQVLARWLEGTMPPLRAAAHAPGPAAARLRGFADALVQLKRQRAAQDPELFAAYRTLAAAAQSVTSVHVEEIVTLLAQIIEAGVREGAFRAPDAIGAARAVLWATARFHHPAHAAEWQQPGVDAAYNAVWRLLMEGLSR